jgi:hypothetical protein
VGAGFGEEGVAAAPGDQRGWPVAAQPLLPGGIEGDVEVVVEGQVELELLVARLVEEVLVKGPAVGCDEVGIRGAGEVLAAGGIQGEQLADPLLGARRVGEQGDEVTGRRAMKSRAAGDRPSS